MLPLDTFARSVAGFTFYLFAVRRLFTGLRDNVHMDRHTVAAVVLAFVLFAAEAILAGWLADRSMRARTASEGFDDEV
jgi:hypothetical protein